MAPQSEIKVTVKAIVSELLPTPSGPIPARRYSLALNNPDGVLEASVTIDARGRLVRLEIPTARLALVRSDLATVATRSQPIRNQNDTDVIIPATGFTLAGTMTMPPGAGRLRHPAIVLVTGSGQIERDETVAGIPIFAQLAGSLAQEGFVVLRYDKRGIGQSGGRSERATLQDYADDLTAAVKWLAKRKDIDPKRIAVAGHSEGGAVAMLAAAREKKISALVLVAAPGTPGADLVLEQQRHLLDAMKAPEAERQAKIELQQRIHAAVIADKGWEAIPPELRAQADSTWFRSLLLFDPAKLMPKVKQPMLIVHGDLDKQVLPHHADTLAKLARARKKAAAGRAGPSPRHQSPAGAGRDRRGVGIPRAQGQDRHAGRRQGHRGLAQESANHLILAILESRPRCLDSAISDPGIQRIRAFQQIDINFCHEGRHSEEKRGRERRAWRSCRPRSRAW